jgi:DNA-binding MarR family transcriptional regulator
MGAMTTTAARGDNRDESRDAVSPQDMTGRSEAALTDPVDWARHFWRRQGLGDSEDAFLAMSSLMRLHRLMVDALESKLRSHELNIIDYMLLMTLHLSETGIRLISQLARSLLIHATTATLATDRLESRKLVARSPHPTDRRATLVSLTPVGRALAIRVTDDLREISFGLPNSTLEDQRTVVAVLGRLRLAIGDTDSPIKAIPVLVS